MLGINQFLIYVKCIEIIIFIVVLAAEIFLSHQDGYKSGNESKKIARFLRVPDKAVRVGAHVASFALLMFMGLVFFSPDYTVIVTVGVGVWCFLDEATKPLMNNYRHFSLPDVFYNVIGSGIGFAMWLLITGIIELIKSMRA